MPRIKEKVRYRAGQKQEDKNEQAFLFIIFWLAVLAEFVGLYSKNYTFYTFARVFVVPILILRVFLSPFYKRVSIYLYSTLISSLFADLFTIFGNYYIAYIGLSLYTVSYFSLGCYFQQINNNHNKSHIVYMVGTLFQIALCLLWIYSPELHTESFVIQIGFHCIVLLYISFWVVANFKKIPNGLSQIFIASVIVILLTSVVYWLDLYFFKRRYTFIDALIGLGNGFYLFLITRGALKQVKKV